LYLYARAVWPVDRSCCHCHSSRIWNYPSAR